MKFESTVLTHFRSC